MNPDNKVISQQRNVPAAQQHFLSVLSSSTKFLRSVIPASGRREAETGMLKCKQLISKELFSTYQVVFSGCQPSRRGVFLTRSKGHPPTLISPFTQVHHELGGKEISQPLSRLF